MDSRRVFFHLRLTCLLVMLVALSILSGCGDEQGDIVAPQINVSAGSVFFFTSDTATLKVDTDVGATIEIAVADDLTASTPLLAGTSATGDTWSFEISGLQPGGNAVAVTASDAKGNQQTLFLTIYYDFLAIDQVFSPVMTVSDFSDYQIMGTVADGGLPTVTVTQVADEISLPVVVANDPAYARRWIATFDLPAVLSAEEDDLYLVEVSYDNGTHSSSLTYNITGTGVVYPVAGIDPQPFEVVESGTNPEDPANRLDDAITLSGTCEAGAAVSLLFNNQDQALVSPCEGGVWSKDVTLNPGKNFVTLTVTDGTTTLATMAYDAIWYLLP